MKSIAGDKKMDWQKICEGCGECCGPIPFAPEFLLQNTDKYQELPEELSDMFMGRIVPITKTLECVFLNKATKRCVIYKKRPQVCRLQGTIPQLPCPRLQAIDSKKG